MATSSAASDLHASSRQCLMREPSGCSDAPTQQPDVGWISFPRRSSQDSGVAAATTATAHQTDRLQVPRMLMFFWLATGPPGSVPVILGSVAESTPEAQRDEAPAIGRRLHRDAHARTPKPHPALPAKCKPRTCSLALGPSPTIQPHALCTLTVLTQNTHTASLLEELRSMAQRRGAPSRETVKYPFVWWSFESLFLAPLPPSLAGCQASDGNWRGRLSSERVGVRQHAIKEIREIAIPAQLR